MLLPLALLVAQAAPAQACPTPAALPARLAGWRQTAAQPTIGTAFVVAAADPATLRGLRAGEVARPGGAALVPFEVDGDATYRIALSDRAWADVVAGDKVVAASAYAHGPACSGMAKLVDFPLKRGRYALHLTGISAPSIRVLITRV
ncbi:MAG TPA: hypothetical protein VFT56_04010 [Sphingomonas sp.]|nr:hypothetical protein [Sphingomonas sp.]